MLRFLKALPLVLALASLSIFAISCGSGGNAQVRVINAIDQTSAVNLDVNINGTKDFPNVPFDTVYPTPTTPASYVSVPSASRTVEAFVAGQTSSPIISTTENFSGSTQYTMLLAGFSNASPAAYLLQDNNTVPTAGNLEVRVINGSALSATSNGIGVSIYQQGQSIPSPTTVAFGQATSYQVLPFESGVPYFMEVFLGQTPQFTYTFTPGGTSTAGSITTLVIVDTPGGSSGISPTPLYLQDLN